MKIVSIIYTLSIYRYLLTLRHGDTIESLDSRQVKWGAPAQSNVQRSVTYLELVDVGQCWYTFPRYIFGLNFGLPKIYFLLIMGRFDRKLWKI